MAITLSNSLLSADFDIVLSTRVQSIPLYDTARTRNTQIERCYFCMLILICDLKRACDYVIVMSVSFSAYLG